MEGLDLNDTPEFSMGHNNIPLDLETTLPNPAHEHTKENDIPKGGGVDSEQNRVVMVQTIIVIVFCLLGTFVNSLVFWVFNRRPALRSLSNRFVLSLISSNLLISCLAVPFMIGEGYIWDQYRITCTHEIIAMISSAVFFSAVFTTVLIATDRYYAVTSPLHYSMTITRGRSQVMILMAWVAGILFAFPHILFCLTSTKYGDKLHMGYALIQVTIGYALPFLALCWLYLRMYHAAHLNSERTRKHSISGELLTVMDGSTSVIPPPGIDFLANFPFNKPPVPGSVHSVLVGAGGVGVACGSCPHNGTSIGQIVPAPAKKQRRRSSNGSSSSLLFREEGRAIKTAFFVLASFLLCWTPHFASVLTKEIQAIRNREFGDVSGNNANPNISSSPSVAATPIIFNDNQSSGFNNDDGADWMQFSEIIAMLLASILNPFIYVFRNKMAYKEVSKICCGIYKERRRHTKAVAASRERNHLVHCNSRDRQDSLQDGEEPDSPRYVPTVGKSPKRSSLKSLTPQSSLNSTTTNCNSIINATSPVGPLGPTNNANPKPPFIRSMTVPEQSQQPRVKFPPNLIRQKSCIHRPVFGTNSAELTPALSKRSKFVRQDSICSILSNDSVLMICEDGFSVSESLLGRCVIPESPELAGNGNQQGDGNNGGHDLGSNSCLSGATRGRNLSGSGTPTFLQKHYLRQDSNFSDSSHKTNDSGVVLSSVPSAKPSANNSPCITHHINSHHCVSPRTGSPSYASVTSTRPHPRHPILQTTI